jgi:tetratricopeptide (TPR) repeat protein
MEKLDKIVERIYSEDNLSPLFVSKADLEIRRGNENKAIEILLEGTSHYPNYAPAFLLLGKAFALIGSYDLSVENIRKGSDLIRSKKTYDYYIDEIEKIKNRKEVEKKQEAAVEEPAYSESESSKREATLAPRPLPVDNNIEDLVKEIRESAAREIVEGNGEYYREIISETLAKIYVSQGEINEAVKMYKKLKNVHPEKVDYFDRRIDELSTNYTL